MRLPTLEKLQNILTPIYGAEPAAYFAEALLSKANLYLREQKSRITTTRLTEPLLAQPALELKINAEVKTERKINATIYENLCELNLAASVYGTFLHGLAKMGNLFFATVKGVLKGTGYSLCPAGVLSSLIPLVMILKYNYYTSASQICQALQSDINLDYPNCNSNQTALIASTCIEQNWAYDRQLHMDTMNITSPVDCLTTEQLYAEGDYQNNIIHDYRYERLPQYTWIGAVAVGSLGALVGAGVEVYNAPKIQTREEAIQYMLSSSLRLISTIDLYALKGLEAEKELKLKFPQPVKDIILSYFFSNDEAKPQYGDLIIEIEDKSARRSSSDEDDSCCCPSSP